MDEQKLWVILRWISQTNSVLLIPHDMNAPDSHKKHPLPGFGDVTHQKVQIDWNHFGGIHFICSMDFIVSSYILKNQTHIKKHVHRPMVPISTLFF